MSSLVPAIGAKHSMKCSLGLWDQRRGVRSCSCYRGQTLNDAFSVFWDQRRGLKRLIPNWGRDGRPMLLHVHMCVCVCMPVDFSKKESALPVRFEGSTEDVIVCFHVPLGVLQAIEGQTCARRVTLDRIVAGSSWSEPLMSPSDGVYWLGMDGPGPLPAEFVPVGSVGTGGSSTCTVGKGVDCLPMAKPVARVISWGSAVGWALLLGPLAWQSSLKAMISVSFGVGDWT